MEWSVRNRDDSASLTHYGVKGMKWGVRKEYEPVGRKRKLLNSAEEQKKSSNGDSVIRNDSLEDREKIKKQLDLLADWGKTPAVYASEEVAKERLDNLPKIYIRQGSDQQAMAVNHNAPTYERRVNCFECTMAYEMRRRGYNVQANEVSGGFAIEAMHAFDVKNSFNVKVTNPEGNYLSNKTLAQECYNRIADRCIRYGDGARGMLGIYYAEPYDGGHAMSWVVENGEFKIIDNQSDVQDPVTTFLMCDGDVDVYRLDNAEILPGVTDFVEPYKRTDQENMAANVQRVTDSVRKAVNNRITVSKVKTLLKNIGLIKADSVGDYISKGIEEVKSFFKSPHNYVNRR